MRENVLYFGILLEVLRWIFLIVEEWKVGVFVLEVRVNVEIIGGVISAGVDEFETIISSPSGGLFCWGHHSDQGHCWGRKRGDK